MTETSLLPGPNPVPALAGATATGGVLGRSEAKVDGLGRITGRAVFAADLRLPRMVVARFVRSPHAHARILGIDLEAALALPGVVGSLVGEELPQRYGAIPVVRDETALALHKVRYIGEPVVCIAAVDEETAFRACQLVKVRYEPLGAVLDIETALNRDAPLIHEEARKASNTLRRVTQKFGDIDAGFAEADLVVEGEYQYPGSTHVPLEAHAALADFGPDGKLTLWSSTQNPHYVHRDLARVLEMRERDIRLIKPAVGAGYGGKCDPFCTELCASALSRKLRRPVRIELTREEVFYAHRGRHPVKMWLKMGLKKDGSITAIDFKAWADGGAYASYGVVTSYYLGVFMTLPYRLENYRFESHRLYTNKPPCGPKRGHGAIQPRYALEAHMDRAAERLGIDPAELRLRNCMDPDSETCNGLRVTSMGMRQCIDAVVEASGWRERRGKLPPGVGLGLAASAYMCGALHPVYANELPQSSVQIKVDRSGDVMLLSGTADIGQGSSHMLAALCAERLGIEPHEVRVIEGDTSLTPVDLGSYSSRVTFMAGNACLAAVEPVRQKLLAVAAEALGRPAADLTLRGGRIGPTEPGEGPEARSLSFVEAVWLAEEKFGPLVSAGGYKPPRIGNRFRRESVGPSPAYSFTAQVAEVEVDLETGVPRVTRIWVAHDCGRAINRTIVEGQIEGCVYMGVGEALYEEQSYSPQGLHRTPSILEYKIPTVYETPEIYTTIIETHDAGGPFGAKEAGEGPQLSTAPAIAAAVRDALRLPTEAKLPDPPFHPERLLREIERSRRSN